MVTDVDLTLTYLVNICLLRLHLTSNLCLCLLLKLISYISVLQWWKTSLGEDNHCPPWMQYILSSHQKRSTFIFFSFFLLFFMFLVFSLFQCHFLNFLLGQFKLQLNQKSKILLSQSFLCKIANFHP